MLQPRPLDPDFPLLSSPFVQCRVRNDVEGACRLPQAFEVVLVPSNFPTCSLNEDFLRFRVRLQAYVWPLLDTDMDPTSSSGPTTRSPKANFNFVTRVGLLGSCNFVQNLLAHADTHTCARRIQDHSV